VVIKYDNIGLFEVEYFNAGVQLQFESWPVGIYADFLRLVELIERHGADLRLPHSRGFGHGLFELRCRGPEGIGRVFYCCQVRRRVVILHGFIKKSMAIPDSELAIARKRMKEILHG